VLATEDETLLEDNDDLLAEETLVAGGGVEPEEPPPPQPERITGKEHITPQINKHLTFILEFIKASTIDRCT